MDTKYNQNLEDNNMAKLIITWLEEICALANWEFS